MNRPMLPRNADANWQMLSVSEQLETALGVAERRVNEWRRMYTAVDSVAAGYRTRGAYPNPTKEVCLRFSVKEKKASTASEQCIPTKVLGYHTTGGIRRPIAIPTDVHESQHGTLETGAPADYYFGRTMKNGVVLKENGSACCVLRQITANTNTAFLLSCCHVFCLIKQNQYQPMTDCSVGRKNSANSSRRIGPVIAHGRIKRNSTSFSNDVALAKIVDFPDLEGLRDMVAPLPLSLAPGGCPEGTLYVSGVWGKTRVRMGDIVPKKDYSIGPYYTMRIRRTYRYYDLNDDGGLRGGFSGSPLINDRGVVYGMHFYSDCDEHNRKRGYAIPMYEILSYFRLNHNLELTLYQPHP